MSENKIEVGQKGTAEILVDETTLASTVGRGNVDVFSTPSLIALMEKAAVNSLTPNIKPEETSVGKIDHSDDLLM